MTAPILRFKDQGGSYPDWVEKKLKDCVTFSKGGSLSKSDLSPHGATPCLLYGELYTTYGEVTKAVINKTDSTEDLVKSQMNDVILPMSGETAEDIAKATCIKQEGVAYGGDLMVLRSKSLDGCFLSYSLNSVNRRQISRIAQGKTVVHINPSRVSDISINIACLEEQQKIAAFFTSLDEKIRLSEQKLNLISKLKNGILQKIFAQELRFQSYNKPWKEKNTLSQIAVVTMGQSPSSESYNEDSEGLPLIQGNADIVDGFTKPQRYTTEVTKRCQEGDVILSVRAPVGELGIASEESCIGRGVCAIRANDKSNTVFIYQFLQAKKKQWKTLEQGSTFTAVSGEDIKTFEVLVPTKEEQQKIAAFFTSFDKKIDIEKKKLNELHRLKTAFMQQMFV